MSERPGCEVFAELNRSRWPELRPGSGSVILNINGIPQQTVLAGVAARLMNQEHGLQPVVLLSPSTKNHADVRTVLESFGIRHFIRLSRNPLARPLALCRAMVDVRRAGRMIAVEGFEAFIQNFQVNGVHLGDLLYDSLIRYHHTYRQPEGDPRKLRRTLRNGLWLFHVCQGLVRRWDARGVVISETVYAISEAMLLRIATQAGHRGLFVNSSFARYYASYEETFRDRFKVTPALMTVARQQPQRRAVVDDYLGKRFTGKLAHHDVINAYRDKRVWTRAELAAHYQLGARADRKAIFLMPHCFSDANHKTRFLLFRDFYQWFRETLRVIREVDDVNWFIKPHPSSHHYLEENQVEELVQQSPALHVFLTPKDFSTTSVLNVADAIVTVNGTIGLEAACAGVRPVLAADAVYGGFGFTLEPQSQTDYFAQLRAMRDVPRLTEAEVATAKDVLYCYQFLTRPKSDIIPSGSIRPGLNAKEFDLIYQGYYRTMAENVQRVDLQADPYLASMAELIRKGHGSIMHSEPGPVA